jgi:alpha-amylase
MCLAHEATMSGYTDCYKTKGVPLTQLLLALIVLFILAACDTSPQPSATSSQPPATSPQPTVTNDQPPATDDQPPATSDQPLATSPHPWWNDAIFYEVFVRSFYDSDGDGVGDISGLIERLDYLNDGDPTTTGDLGVTGLWLMPVMESPSYHGYDVVDYFQVDREYGSNDDFQRLIEEAHARGMRVIVDLVLNHTGRDHPWFQESVDPDSERRDWYVWSEENPGYPGPWGQRVWHSAPAGGYYYGVFWEGMPDLNLANPEVEAAAQEAARFWLEDMGADGFRLDAIKHLIEDGRVQENTPATHEWLREFYTFYKDIDPEAFAVGEAWTSTQQVLDYTGDEVDIAFQFDLAADIVNSSEVGIGSLFADEMAAIVEAYPPGQYATFITNHDQNRVMSQLGGDEAAAKVAASLLLTSPGVPFIYYGEEIGMMGVKPDEDIRLPMQWSAGEGAGFTEGAPWRPPYEDYPERNVAAQGDDPDSLLNHYRTLIRLRNDHEALRTGDWLGVDTHPGRLLALLRHTEDETLLVIVNPSKNEVADYALVLTEGPLAEPVEATLLFGEGSVVAPTVNAAGGFTEYTPLSALPPQSSFIIQLS